MAAEEPLFSRSVFAAAVLGIGLGTVLLLLGIAVDVNWRGWAERYALLIDALTLSRPRELRRSADEQWQRRVRQQRVVFGLIACFGALILVAGVIATLRHA